MDWQARLGELVQVLLSHVAARQVSYVVSGYGTVCLVRAGGASSGLVRLVRVRFSRSGLSGCGWPVTSSHGMARWGLLKAG